MVIYVASPFTSKHTLSSPLLETHKDVSEWIDAFSQSMAEEVKTDHPLQ
jgi:hypothetical protein